MKDINLVINILKSNNISSAEYARNICTTRQNVQNWTDGRGIPKKYLLPTVQFLTALLQQEITIEQLISLNIPNDTKDETSKSSANKMKKVS